MSRDLLFDTNAIIAASSEPLRLVEATSRARTLSVSFVSVAELLYGALNSAQAGTNIVACQQRLERFRIIQPSSRTPMAYAKVRLALSKRGLSIPANDLWIAALAIENNLPLVTRDAQFECVEGLTVLGF